MGSTNIIQGQNAGQTNQGSYSIAIGTQAGQTNQSSGAVAIGLMAGQGTQGGNAVAIGGYAGQISQGGNSIAIGNQAGNFSQGGNAIAIGFLAGQTNQHSNSIVLNASGAVLNTITGSSLYVNPIRGPVTGTNVLYYDSLGKEVTWGEAPSGGGGGIGVTGTFWGDYLYWSSATSAWVVGSANVSLGKNAGAVSQGTSAVAIGNQAGNSTQGGQAVAIGYYAGRITQGQQAVAIGTQAGQTNQSSGAVAIGFMAGQGTQGGNAVAIGTYAGFVSQGLQAVAIGTLAGNFIQGTQAIAMGFNAGVTLQGTYSVAIGSKAGMQSQGQYAVAIGYYAGNTLQRQNAVAIGTSAGFSFQGLNAVAIGYQAGYAAQADNSIVLNATGGILNAGTASATYIAPVRGITGSTTNVMMTYDNSFNEVQRATDISYNVSSLSINKTTEAYATTSGALTVSGGVGIGGNVYVGGNVFIKGLFMGTTTNVISYSGIQSYNNTTPISIASSTLTLINLGTAVRDTTQQGLNLTYVSGSQYYQNQTGNTLSCSLSFTFQWNPNAVGTRILFISHNSLGTISTASTQATTYDSIIQTCSTSVTIRPSEYIQFYVYQSSGSSLSNVYTLANFLFNYAGYNINAGNAITLGSFAGNTFQGANAIAIGSFAGFMSQGGNAIAIGLNAGYISQGGNAIAIGVNAGQTSQPAGSIVLNATGLGFTASNANAFYVAPIRAFSGTTQSSLLAYDTSSFEINYATNITLSGTIAASALYSLSDRRLKGNVELLPSILDKIRRMEPVSYEWTHSGKSDFGFIAQDFYRVFPELRPVEMGEEENPINEKGEPQYYSMDYGKITCFLTKAVQEQQVLIQELQMENQKQQVVVQELQMENQKQQVVNHNLEDRLIVLERTLFF